MEPQIRYFKKLNNIYEGAMIGEIYRAQNNFNIKNISDHYLLFMPLMIQPN